MDLYFTSSFNNNHSAEGDTKKKASPPFLPLFHSPHVSLCLSAPLSPPYWGHPLLFCLVACRDSFFHSAAPLPLPAPPSLPVSPSLHPFFTASAIPWGANVAARHTECCQTTAVCLPLAVVQPVSLLLCVWPPVKLISDSLNSKSPMRTLGPWWITAQSLIYLFIYLFVLVAVFSANGAKQVCCFTLCQPDKVPRFPTHGCMPWTYHLSCNSGGLLWLEEKIWQNLPLICGQVEGGGVLFFRVAGKIPRRQVEAGTHPLFFGCISRLL